MNNSKGTATEDKEATEHGDQSHRLQHSNNGPDHVVKYSGIQPPAEVPDAPPRCEVGEVEFRPPEDGPHRRESELRPPESWHVPPTQTHLPNLPRRSPPPLLLSGSSWLMRVKIDRYGDNYGNLVYAIIIDSTCSS